MVCLTVAESQRAAGKITAAQHFNYDAIKSVGCPGAQNIIRVRLLKTAELAVECENSTQPFQKHEARLQN